MPKKDNVYEVDRIIKHKYVTGRQYFFVKWKGYAASYNSWEPEENFIGCTQLLREYFSSTAAKSVVRVAGGGLKKRQKPRRESAPPSNLPNNSNSACRIRPPVTVVKSELVKSPLEMPPSINDQLTHRPVILLANFATSKGMAMTENATECQNLTLRSPPHTVEGARPECCETRSLRRRSTPEADLGHFEKRMKVSNSPPVKMAPVERSPLTALDDSPKSGPECSPPPQLRSLAQESVPDASSPSPAVQSPATASHTPLLPSDVDNRCHRSVPTKTIIANISATAKNFVDELLALQMSKSGPSDGVVCAGATDPVNQLAAVGAERGAPPSDVEDSDEDFLLKRDDSGVVRQRGKRPSTQGAVRKDRKLADCGELGGRRSVGPENVVDPMCTDELDILPDADGGGGRYIDDAFRRGSGDGSTTKTDVAVVLVEQQAGSESFFVMYFHNLNLVRRVPQSLADKYYGQAVIEYYRRRSARPPARAVRRSI